MPSPIRLYRHALSGHAHRVELLLSLLGLPHELIEVDLLAGAQKTPEFLAKNPFGQVPVIEDGPLTLADSNAILVYLASRYDEPRRWLPTDPVAAAQVQRWLSVAAGPLAAGPATARLVKVFGAPRDYAAALQTSRWILGILDAHLASRPFLVGEGPTVADVALYSYTAHAPEGGVPLSGFTNIIAWLRRIETLPGFVPMQRSPSAA